MQWDGYLFMKLLRGVQDHWPVDELHYFSKCVYGPEIKGKIKENGNNWIDLYHIPDDSCNGNGIKLYMVFKKEDFDVVIDKVSICENESYGSMKKNLTQYIKNFKKYDIKEQGFYFIAVCFNFYWYPGA